MLVRAWCVVALAASAALAQTWTELGPAPISGFGGATGRVSAIACSPTNGNRWYVTGADGGVWRTSDSGLTWAALTDHMPTTAMGALALDPTDENVIYAGSGEANFANHSRYGLGIFRSADGGASWEVRGSGVFSGRCISRIIVHPTTPATLYAGVTRAGGFPSPAAAKGHPGAGGPVGVFRSNDAGLTWVQLAGGVPALDATDLAMDPSAPGTLYAAIGHIFGSASNGIYKTTDGGTTWSRLAGGLPTSDVGRIGIAVAPSNGQRLYAYIAEAADSAGGGASTRGAYRSDDGGANWVSLPIGSTQSTYGWYFTTVTVQPTNPDTVFFGALGIRRSTNAGASFTSVDPPHPDVHAFAWDAGGRLISGDDGGIHLTSNLGAAWASRNTGLGITQLYAGLSTHPTNAFIMFAGLQDNGTNRRTSASLLWTHVLGGDGGWTQVDQANPLRVFAESQGTGLLSRSTDGGVSFSGLGTGITGRNCFLPPFLIDPTNSNRMLYATERVWVSTTGGSAWAPLSADLTGGGTAAIRSLAIAPSDPLYVYAATNDGRVLVSTNGGSVFTLILSGNPGWPRVTREVFVDPDDARTVYLAGAGFGATQVRRSRDAGTAWEPLDAGLPDVPVNTLAVDTRYPRPRIYAGTDAGLLVSRDEGGSWSPYGTGLPNAAVIDLQIEPARGRLVAGTQGRGAWLAPVFCPADLDMDGFVSGDDFEFFVLAFEGGSPEADFDADGFLTGDDFAAFVTAFERGC